MLIRPLMLLALVAGPPALARQSTQERAQSFKLDAVAPTPEPSASATPAADPTAAPVRAEPASPLATPGLPESAAVTTPPAGAAAASAPALRASFTLDTPIGDLIGDPAAKAVLDKDLPGLSTDDNLDKFVKLGLRQFQPLTGGQLTDAMLAKVATDLSSLSGPLLAPVVPVAGGTSKRNHDRSR